MEENLQEEDNRRNLLNLYFNAWKDLHLSHMLEQRTETAALVYYSVNLKTKAFSAWNKILEDNRRYRSAALVIQAKSNLALKRKVFKGIDIIVKRRDVEDQFVAKLVMMYIKGLYRKSFEGWKDVTQESLAEQEKTLTALLCWKNNMLKKFFYLLQNWKSFVRPKSEREYEQNLLTKTMWRKVFIGKLRNSLVKKRKLYSDLGRAFGLRDHSYVKKAVAGWKEYMEDQKYKKSIKPIYDDFVQGRNEKILRAYYAEWRREFFSEQEKEKILEELIEGEWAVRSQFNAKKRAIGMIKDVIFKKNDYYRGIWANGVLKKVFSGWKGMQKMSNKHKMIYKEMRMKVIKRYFRKLKEYQDECKVKDGRKMIADKFYRKITKERLFEIWRKRFLWIEHSRNVEEVMINRRILFEKRRVFAEWKNIAKRKIELREKEDIIRDNMVKKAWRELHKNLQDGRRKDEMNRIVRRFRYFRLLRLSLRGLKDSVRMRYLKLEGEDKALGFERQYILGKAWKNWMKFLRQRAEKREERDQETKMVNQKMLKKILREWRIQAEERKERRDQEKESRRYYEMGVLKKVMRRWKIFHSIRQEKRGYGNELEGIIRLTLGFRRFKKRALEMAKDRKAIQKSVTKLTLIRKASYFGEFYKKVQMNKRLRELKERAENYGEFYLKKKALIGFILNRKMNKRERKANHIALEQWCFFRYKMVIKKFQEFIEDEKRRRDEEILALEMKKEHIRKEVFSKLLEKGLELRDREFKKKVKSKIMSDMKEYTLMRKYAMKWLDFYYKRTGRIRGGQKTLFKAQRTQVRSPIMDKSSALSMRDLEKEKSITLERKSKQQQVNPIKKKEPKKLAASFKAELEPKPRAEPRGRKIEQEDDVKENEGLRSNLGGSTRLRTSSKGAEKQIMDWFETKRNERKQPKRAPVVENRGNESMMISRDFMLSPFEKSNIREERNQHQNNTHNHDLFESISPREEIIEIEEEVTQEDLDEKVHILEGMLKEMKRSKERLLVLRERRDDGDRNEISMINKVLDVQKKDAKELLIDIRRMKEILGVE